MLFAFRMSTYYVYICWHHIASYTIGKIVILDLCIDLAIAMYTLPLKTNAVYHKVFGSAATDPITKLALMPMA